METWEEIAADRQAVRAAVDRLSKPLRTVVALRYSGRNMLYYLAHGRADTILPPLPRLQQAANGHGVELHKKRI